MTDFNLKKEREKFKKDMNYALGKFNWGASALDADAIRILNEWRIKLDERDAEFIKVLKEHVEKIEGEDTLGIVEGLFNLRTTIDKLSGELE